MPSKIRENGRRPSVIFHSEIEDGRTLFRGDRGEFSHRQADLQTRSG